MNKKRLKEEIDNITNQIIKRYKPEKVILFGSAAQGRFDLNSDLDFLIIKKKVPHYGIDRMRQIRRLVNTSFPCDFLVVKPEEIKQRLKWEDPFVEQMIYKGKTLYG